MAFAIRPATLDDANTIAAVHVTSWRETYEGLVPATLLASSGVPARMQLWRHVLTRPEQDTSGVFVASHAGETIGFVHAAAQRTTGLRDHGFTGEISALYVLASCQQRGAGAGLLQAAMASLASRGHQAVSLWVLHDNFRARRFYERHGGAVTGEQQDRCSAVTLQEVAYGWRAPFPV